MNDVENASASHTIRTTAEFEDELNRHFVEVLQINQVTSANIMGWILCRTSRTVLPFLARRIARVVLGRTFCQTSRTVLPPLAWSILSRRAWMDVVSDMKDWPSVFGLKSCIEMYLPAHHRPGQIVRLPSLTSHPDSGQSTCNPPLSTLL